MPDEIVSDVVESVTDSVSDAVSDTVTETEHVGFGSKLMESIKGVLVGLLLVAAAGVGLFWNEGRAVTTQRSLTEGASQVQHIETDRVAPENEGKLVHVAGPFATKAPLIDPEFQVQATGAVLVRHVEMYQWKEDKETETQKNFGGSEERKTTYRYSKVWSSSQIDSRQFKAAAGHANPQMRYRDLRVAAKDGTMGAFRPSDAVLRNLAASDAMPLDTQMAEALSQRLGRKVQIVAGEIYLGDNPDSPVIGDLRISYKLANPSVISIVGRQAGSDFAPYQTKAGDTLLFVKSGNVDAAQIFKAAQDENRILTWILRLVGLLFMVGFTLLMGPLVALGDIVPFIGNVLGAGALLVGMVLTAIVGPTVMAIAWLWYRPLVGIGMIAAGIAVAFALKRWGPRRKPKAAAAPAAAVPAA
jgi:hypothetical protein